MTAEQLFLIANNAALLGWIALAAVPGRRFVNEVLCARLLPAIFAVVYVGILLVKGPESQGGFGSLGDVALLFSNRWLLLAGWIHYLAFDMVVGSWEVRDARERGIRHLWVVPCVALTFMFGPAGWLAYLGVRRVNTRSGAPLPER